MNQRQLADMMKLKKTDRLEDLRTLFVFFLSHRVLLVQASQVFPLRFVGVDLELTTYVMCATSIYICL